MPIQISASMLYDHIQCPQRVSMDLYGDSDKRDPVSAFVRLLWEKGHLFERQVIDGLDIPFTNLSSFSGEEKEHKTREATERSDTLIYAGRISVDDLVGEPDLLRWQGNGYVAGDIKSGAGEEGATEDISGKPKKHYAVQLALYTDILERISLSGGRTPFVWDIHGQEVAYELDSPQGPRTPASLWDLYQSTLTDMREIISRSTEIHPALASACKLCHWRSACLRQLEECDDLTLIPELGRAKRDAMVEHVAGVKALADVDVAPFIKGVKSIFPRIGSSTLMKYQARARLLAQRGAEPYLREPLDLPTADFELFFDIETDPMREVCYLHGFVERRGADSSSERYVAFFVDHPTPEEEKRAFAAAWEYISAATDPIIYYYAPYERTWWRKLQERYPDVVSQADVEAMFASERAIDLYSDVIRAKTEWPTRDHSIKTLATFLGFSWRDSEPSGAASIEWYHRWVDTDDPAVRQRILNYNEDDCRAMRVLVDALAELQIRTS